MKVTGMGGCVVPADGVKGKTWGPSTCHQRERGQIMSRPKRWSKSAPNLEKPSRPRALLGELRLDGGGQLASTPTNVT